MTLCIAAHAIWDEKPCVVVGADLNTETEVSSAEIQYKAGFIPGLDGKRAIPFLMAGSLAHAARLVYRIREGIHCMDDDALYNDCLREAVRKFKNELANDYVGMRYGLTYEDFLSRSAQFPSEEYRQTVSDISRITLQCTLIVVTPHKDISNIFRVNDNGFVEYCENFAAIGSGMFVAESALFHRSHMDAAPLPLAIYNVFEAMTLGSHAPGVGTKFELTVLRLEENGDLGGYTVTAKGRVKLAASFKQFGPKRVENLKFDSSLLSSVWPEGEIIEPAEKLKSRAQKATMKAAGK